ncbi:MAG TPA: sodium:solute symporter [Lacunisphaera sp.]|nr:sodium:solute symporter [Lacunisphaera sp.]
MNALDYLVTLGVLVGIAAYGIWRTRGHQNLRTYLRGSRETKWFTIGLSVMATQASAITFLSTPGQGYESGLGFVQNYFGAPLALIVIAAVFLPIYRKLNVYTAYEYLGKRFDSKTRLLGAALFLLQRGLGAGITIYAPAIVLSTVMGWRLDVTIIGTGLLVVIYTVAGGSDAVNLTQKYQIGVIFVGMVTAFFVLLARLPAGLSFGDALAVAGGFHKLEAVDFSLNPDRRYTIWTGVLGGMFLALSYFGTDQSQVQRYLTGASLRESRLGLMFNAIFKIPMQFFILLLGALVFVFYQFERPPVFFNQAAWHYAADHGAGERLQVLEHDFEAAFTDKERAIQAWMTARHAGDVAAASASRTAALAAQARVEAARTATKETLRAADPRTTVNDADYVFITFILDHLPHGLIGLLVAVFFAAAFSSKAGELNALGSTTTVDIYRHVVKRDAADAHYVTASKWFTTLWGLVAIGFALFASLAENLIQATNIIGSVFYGVVLGLFLLAFFFKRVGGTAVFWAAIVSQALVLVLYFSLSISYLWYNVIGCAACMILGFLLQAFLPKLNQPQIDSNAHR